MDEEVQALRKQFAAEIGKIRVHQELDILDLDMDLKGYNEFVGDKSMVAELQPSGLVRAWETGVGVEKYYPVQQLYDLANSRHAFTALIFAWLYDALLDDNVKVYDQYLDAIGRGADSPEYVEWDIADDAYAKLLTGHLLLQPQFEDQEISNDFLSLHSDITARLLEIYVTKQVPRLP